MSPTIALRLNSTVALPLLSTSRLILRQWNVKDIQAFSTMNADKEVMQFFPRLQSFEESMQFVESMTQKINDNGLGLFAVELKSSGEFIGFIGLNAATFSSDFTPCMEVGWRLRKEFWNCGLATEGARECLRYAFDERCLHEIYSFTSTLNTPSERVMQKIGMKKVSEFDHPRVPEGSPLKSHVLYRITQDEYHCID